MSAPARGSSEPDDAHIRALLRRLPRRSGPAHIARAVLRGEQLPGSTHLSARAALCNVAGETWRGRCVAAWLLGRLPLPDADRPAAARDLADVLDDRLRPDRMTAVVRSWWRSLFLVGLPVVAVGVLATLRMAGPEGSADALPYALQVGAVGMLLVAALATPVMLPLSLLWVRARRAHVRTEAATTLGKLLVPDTVGALARAARRDDDARSGALRALQALLPRLREAHYGALPSDAVPSLCGLLRDAAGMEVPNHACSEALALAIVEALGRFAGGSAAGAVQAVARDAASPPIRQAAEAVLPVLRDRQRREREQARLLRASEAPSAPDLLLRPAGDAAVDLSALVRPVQDP